MTVKVSNGKVEFQEDAKQYVINMIRKSGTLYIKNTDNCPWSVFLSEYVDFDTLEEAQGSMEFKQYCKCCFK